MAKKKELIEEPTEVVVPAVEETVVEETVVEETPVASEPWDGHKTRAYRG
jgi:hypothetical protein